MSMNETMCVKILTLKGAFHVKMVKISLVPGPCSALHSLGTRNSVEKLTDRSLINVVPPKDLDYVLSFCNLVVFILYP